MVTSVPLGRRASFFVLEEGPCLIFTLVLVFPVPMASSLSALPAFCCSPPAYASVTFTYFELTKPSVPSEVFTEYQPSFLP